MQTQLFDEPVDATEWIATDVLLLRRFATSTAALVATIDTIAERAPFRQMQTPGGGRMSVAMTNCGDWGW